MGMLRMEKFKQLIAIWPAWIVSILTILAILWLTLAPKPLGEEPPPLFPGADKIAHAIMFGGLSVTLLFDWQRKHKWKPITFSLAFLFALFSAVFGLVIEVAQSGMGLGRSFEFGDVIADTAGAYIFALFYLILQNLWCHTPYK